MRAPRRSLSAVGALVAVVLGGGVLGGGVLPAASAAASTPLVADAFSRTVVSGLGSAERGGAYVLSGRPEEFRVAGSAATVTVPSGGESRSALLPGARAGDARASVVVGTDRTPTGYGQLAALVLRSSDAGEYRVRARFAGDGSVRLSVARFDGSAETYPGGEVTLPGLAHRAGQSYVLTADVTGSGPTTVRVRLAPVGAAQPVWQLTAQDPAGLPAGAVGLWAYVSPEAGAVATRATFDELAVSTPSAAAPAPTAPAPAAPAPAPTSSAPSAPAPTAAAPAPPAGVVALAGARAGAPTLGSTRYEVPAGAFWVAPNGDDAGPGSASRPWRTVGRAVLSAPVGATVVVRGGTYHEQVEFPRGKRLTLQNAPGEAVWFDGTERVQGWTADGGAWRHDGWLPRFDHSDPSGVMTNARNPLARYPDMAWHGGAQLRQVASRGEVRPGTFFVDEAAQRLWVGNDPTRAEVRASSLAEAIYVNGGHGSVVRGVGVRGYATPIARMGALKAYADRVVVQDVVVEDNATAGISVRGVDVVVRACRTVRNGQLGLHAFEADRLRVEGCEISDNNTEHFEVGQHAGGAKVTTLRGVALHGNRVERNEGVGLWMDESVKGATVTGNLVQDNTYWGVQFEISAQLVMAGNVVARGGDGGVRVLDASQAEIWNNVFVDNTTAIDLLDGPRRGADLNQRGHDTRHPLPDPDQTWEVERVRVRGNLVVAGASSTRPLIGFDDVRKQRGADGRDISWDRDLLWRPAAHAPGWVANLADYPTGMIVGSSLDEFSAKTGQEPRGVGVDGGTAPVAVHSAGVQVTRPDVVPDGTDALPASVAAALGLPAGTHLPAGLPGTGSAATPTTTAGSPVAAPGGSAAPAPVTPPSRSRLVRMAPRR